MNESILMSIKSLLGNKSTDDTTFDEDLVIFINAAFHDLHLLGVNDDKDPFSITGNYENWNDFMDENELKKLQIVKTYIYFHVKLAFDPPASGTLVEAYESQKKRCETYLKYENEKGGL